MLLSLLQLEGTAQEGRAFIAALVEANFLIAFPENPQTREIVGKGAMFRGKIKFTQTI